MDADRLDSLTDLVRRVRHDASGSLTVALGHIRLLLNGPAALNEDAQRSLRVVEEELRRIVATLRRLDAPRAVPPREG